MKITLEKLEFLALEEQFNASSGGELVQSIRKKLPDKVNKRIRFKYVKSPFCMEIEVEPQCVAGLIRVLSPSSTSVKKIQKQVGKISMSQAVKQFGLVMALKDLKNDFFKCF